MPKENQSQYAILGLLISGCHSGYEIKRRMDQSLDHFWTISYGQIYPTLKRLVEEQWATVQTTSQPNRPDKKEYFITSRGMSVFQEWLKAPIQKIPTQKNELLLKLFFSRHQDSAELVNQIQHYSEQLKVRMQTYYAIEETIQTLKENEEDKEYWLLTLDYGRRITQAALEWCEETADRMTKKEEGFS